MPLSKVFMMVNLDKFLWMITLALQKDMLIHRDVSVLEMAFFRSGFTMIASAILVKCVYSEALFYGIPVELRPALSVRSIAGTLGFYCLQIATKYLPLGIITVVCRFNLFTTAALSALWISEWITCFEVIAMVLSFGGIVLIGIA